MFDHNLIMNDLNVLDHPLDRWHVYLLLDNLLESAKRETYKKKLKDFSNHTKHKRLSVDIIVGVDVQLLHS